MSTMMGAAVPVIVTFVVPSATELLVLRDLIRAAGIR